MSTGATAAVEELISADEAALLVPSLSTRAQLHEIERLNIHAARVWAMRSKVLRRDDLLSEEFCGELHRRMFGGVWRGAGKYRSTDSIAGWEPGRIAEGVALFLADAEGWLRYATYPVHEAAVRLHHRLVSVRPWQNGNGRHARLVADVVVASMNEAPLTWGSLAPLPHAARSRYIEAIRAADGGDMAALVAFAQG